MWHHDRATYFYIVSKDVGFCCHIYSVCGKALRPLLTSEEVQRKSFTALICLRMFVVGDSSGDAVSSAQMLKISAAAAAAAVSVLQMNKWCFVLILFRFGHLLVLSSDSCQN